MDEHCTIYSFHALGIQNTRFDELGSVTQFSSGDDLQQVPDDPPQLLCSR